MDPCDGVPAQIPETVKETEQGWKEGKLKLLNVRKKKDILPEFRHILIHGC